MKTRRALFFAVLISLACAMPACTPSSPPTTEVNLDKFVGEWEFIYGSSAGLDKETVEFATSRGSIATMTLNEDGTGSLDLYGTVRSLTWSATSETEGTMQLEGSAAASMALEDDQLKLIDSTDQTLTFRRYGALSEKTAEAVAGDEAAGGGGDVSDEVAGGAARDEAAHATENAAASDELSSSES